MDVRQLTQDLIWPKSDGARLIIDLSQWRFVCERDGICYFEHTGGRAGVYGVAAELISHMRHADAPEIGDTESIRKAIDQLGELSRRVPSL